jgi:hypothetical protein
MKDYSFKKSIYMFGYILYITRSSDLKWESVDEYGNIRTYCISIGIVESNARDVKLLEIILFSYTFRIGKL